MDAFTYQVILDIDMLRTLRHGTVLTKLYGTLAVKLRGHDCRQGITGQTVENTIKPEGFLARKEEDNILHFTCISSNQRLLLRSPTCGAASDDI